MNCTGRDTPQSRSLPSIFALFWAPIYRSRCSITTGPHRALCKELEAEIPRELK